MEKETTQLKSGVLSLMDCMMIAIGGMVGSSIFTLSGVTYSLAGPAAILSWIIAGAVLLLYALNVAELATIYPESGGIYVYPYKVLGKTKSQKTFMGWLAAWSWLNTSVLGTAFSAIFVSHYLSAIIPAAEKYQVLIAVLWIALCWLLNIKGIAFMGKVNLLLTFSLIGICLIYILVGIPAVDMNNFKPFVGQGILGTQGIFTSIPIAMLAYGSIIAIASVAEEIKDPRKTIPKATGYSVLITVIMYSLILFVTFGLVPASDFISDEGAAYAPLHYATMRSLPGKPWLSTLVSVGALLAITTTMLVLVMDAGRTTMAAARSGLLPSFLSKIDSKSQVPVNAITVVSVIAAIIACFPQFTMQIIGTGSLCSGITVIILTITLIVNRKNNAQVEGAFRVPGGMLFPALTLIILAVTLSKLERDAYILSGYWYLLGLAIFIIAYLTNKDNLKDLT